jgi:hypothetical protein
LDPAEQPWQQRFGRHGDPAEGTSRRATRAGELVEQIVNVGRELFVGAEDAEIGVEACGLRVVVAGRDVDVSPEPIRLAAHHQAHLRVILESHHAEHNGGAAFL